MSVHTARDLSTGADHRFRTLSGLTRRLGGDDIRPEETPSPSDPHRRMMVVRTDRHGTHVMTRVLVPVEAVEDVDAPVGRPPVGPMISLRLPPDLVARLDRLAEAEHSTRSALIRRAIETLLAS